MNSAAPGGSLKFIMIDVQHDSPVPVHEQISRQIIAHVASGVLPPGAALPEYRAFAQQLVTNPQVVARAYADLEWDGVLVKNPAGGMEVAPDAAGICRFRQQDAARQRLCQAVRDGRACGLTEADIRQAVEEELASRPEPEPAPAPAEAPEVPKISTHVRRYRTAPGVEVLPRQEGGQPPQPERPPGGDIRPARG